MKKKTKQIILIIFMLLIGIFFLSGIKLFAISPVLVGTIGNLQISYQLMTSGCVVRLTQLPSFTTWVGKYDVDTQGRKNADSAKEIGWIDDTNYPIMVNLLADNPPNESDDCSIIKSCIPSCVGKNCGDDSCGGSCGTCQAGKACQSGACISSCTPSCYGKECGNDSCGGSCGTCYTDKICSNNGECVDPITTCFSGNIKPECINDVSKICEDNSAIIIKTCNNGCLYDTTEVCKKDEKKYIWIWLTFIIILGGIGIYTTFKKRKK